MVVQLESHLAVGSFPNTQPALRSVKVVPNELIVTRKYGNSLR